jgi:hypothetical protein
MKRRITPDQLNQLTEEQKQKLRELWKPEIGDWFYFRGMDKNEDRVDETQCIIKFATHKGELLLHYAEYARIPKSECLPLLDISMMIELLESHNINWCDKLFKISYYNEYEEIFDENHIAVDELSASKEEITKWYRGELCDALFEAVKAVL